jgi:hypothetical protein
MSNKLAARAIAGGIRPLGRSLDVGTIAAKMDVKSPTTGLPAIERKTAKWASVLGGDAMWKQDVACCSLADWDRIKGTPAYAGWYVSLFANSVVLLSPGRSI